MRKTLFAVSGLVLLALAGLAGAFVTGFGPAPGGASDDVESFPTETPTATTPSDGDDTATDSVATPTRPFGFAIERIEDCGRTCRDVTSTVTNRQETTAGNVTVYTRIYVGNDTDGDVAWEGTEPVGTLEAGESHTATRRVELSYSDAFAVEQNGGWVTVQTTVETDTQTTTFTEQRRVA